MLSELRPEPDPAMAEAAGEPPVHQAAPRDGLLPAGAAPSDARALAARHLATLQGCAPGEPPPARGGEGHDPEELQHWLRRLGCRVRLVGFDPRGAARTLPRLEAPALLFLADGQALVMRRCLGRDVLVEDGAGGRRLVRLRALAAACTGQALESPSRASTSGGLGRALLAVLAHRRGGLLQLAGVTLALLAFALLPPVFTGLALDRALPDRALSLLEVLAAATLLVAVHRAWLSTLRERVVRALDARVEAELGQGVFDDALRLPLPAAQRRSVGELLQALGSAEAVARLFTRAALLPLLDALLGLASLALVAVLLPFAALLAVAAAGLLAVVAGVLGQRHARLQAQELELSSRQQSRLYELLAANASVKAAGAERLLVARWMGGLAEQEQVGLQRAACTVGLRVSFAGAHDLVALGLLGWGAAQVLDGSLSVGALVAGVQLVLNTMRSFGDLAGVALELGGAAAHARRMRAACAAAPAPAPPAGPAPAWPAAGQAGNDRLQAPAEVAVAAAGVWFRYGPDQPWVLTGFDLQVGRGEHRVVSGPSGWGKTTVLRLLAGLYLPEQGAVRVLGRAPAEVRDQIAYLPQDLHLFEGSLLDNLRLLSDAPVERIARAARLTGLDDLVAGWPMGYETLIPAGGGNLSGGQRQLVLLTACAATEKPILLLDEAFSNLDRLAQARLLGSDLFAGKTVVAVSHEAPARPAPAAGPGGPDRRAWR